jgi:hypothetical protein
MGRAMSWGCLLLNSSLRGPTVADGTPASISGCDMVWQSIELRAGPRDSFCIYLVFMSGYQTSSGNTANGEPCLPLELSKRNNRSANAGTPSPTAFPAMRSSQALCRAEMSLLVVVPHEVPKDTSSGALDRCMEDSAQASMPQIGSFLESVGPSSLLFILHQ